ncbi:hypothetical protein ACLSU7_17185 [Bdellovibrio sp. HCB185ZH]|uniref:hypothetical protein n=1 Tax=Bdellovibrio sp. HCB185ZH TaxID=3394235 RepID=UPI0039A71E08
MRHFATLTAITLALTTTLVACRDSSSTNPESLKPSGISNQTLQPSPTEQTTASNDNRGFTPNTSLGQKLQQAYPLEYACTQQLCSNDFQKYPSLSKMTETAAIPTEAQKKYYADYIQSALLKYYAARKINSEKWLSLLEAKENDFSTIKLSDDQLRILQTLNALQNADKIPQMKKYWNGKFQEVDFQKAFGIYQHMGKWTYLQQMYPNLSLTEAAQNELKFIESNFTRLEKIVGGANSLDAVITAKIKASEPLDLEEMEELTEYALSIRRLEHFLFGPGNAIITDLMKTSPLTQEQLFKIYSQKKFQKELTKQIQTDLKDNCSERYYQSINLYPQPTQLAKFKELAEQTRESALAILHPQDPAYEKIKEIQFLYPSTSDKNSTAWLASLRSKISSIEDDTVKMDQLDSQSLYGKALILTMFAKNASEVNLCPKIPDTKVSDKNAVGYGYVMVSWYSVKFPELGASILAHELGHSVFAFSSNSESTKSCVKQKQSTEFFADEDFADLFSAKVSQELKSKYQVPTGNMACALMDSLYPLQSRDMSDPHSTLLYRALQIRIASGEQIPTSCQQLAERDNTSATRRCN